MFFPNETLADEALHRVQDTVYTLKTVFRYFIIIVTRIILSSA
jgi:hypothetical protein